MPPVVSINLCCYNGEKYLEEALASIGAQTFADWELVVVNDGSTDGTERILQEHLRRGWPIVYHAQANAGLAASRATAARLSCGQFIAFIDQDDVWLPTKLERQVGAFGDADVGMVYSNFAMLIDGKSGRPIINDPIEGQVFRRLMGDEYPISMSTAMVRTAAVRALDHVFDPRFQLIEDKDLFVRLAYSWKVAYVDEVLSHWRVHAENTTLRKYARFAAENRMLIEKLRETIPDFDAHYRDELREHLAKISYQDAVGSFLSGEPAVARSHLRGVKWARKKYLLAYLMTYVPSSLAGRCIRLYLKHLHNRI